MKHIEKGSEPTEFTQWKDCVNDPENVGWRPAWGNFQNPEKTMVHNSLLQEQGYICCYCMKRIDRVSSRIEHIVPRSKTNEQRRLAYDNMPASCHGEDESADQVHLHCGHFRGDWYEPNMFVTPLKPSCEQEFTFYDDGAIRPTQNNSAAKRTIGKLGLDCSLLLPSR